MTNTNKRTDHKSISDLTNLYDDVLSHSETSQTGRTKQTTRSMWNREKEVVLKT